MHVRTSHFSQLIWYAKQLYQQTPNGVLQDLKQIVGHTHCLPAADITEGDIARLLSLAVIEYIWYVDPHLARQRVTRWVEGLVATSSTSRGCGPLTIIEQCLGFLSTAPVVDKNQNPLIHLEPVDPIVLPLAEQHLVRILADAVVAKAADRHSGADSCVHPEK